MGPGDPFSTSRSAEPAARAGWDPPPAHEAVRRPYDASAEMGEMIMTNGYGGLVTALVGLVVGLAFGVLVMLAGTWSALAVLASGGAGALVAWIAYGIASGSLDLSGAWRTLRRR